MTSRDELRSFGANLVLGIDALFFGSALFIYVFRRRSAGEWLDGWTEAPWARTPLLLGVALLVLAPVLYRRPVDRLAALAGGAGAAALGYAAGARSALVLESGSRAPLIALGFFTIVFAIHASVLAAAGLTGRGSPYFRRLLWFQAGFAVLILPLVFCW